MPLFFHNKPFSSIMAYHHSDYSVCLQHPKMQCACRTSVIMTLWPRHILLIHDITTKYPMPAELTKLTRDSSCK
jgi:hypothetical protein